MNKWIETHGVVPEAFGNIDYGWVRWDDGTIDFTETWNGSLIEWDRTTHFYPDEKIIIPEFSE